LVIRGFLAAAQKGRYAWMKNIQWGKQTNTAVCQGEDTKAAAG
jgi:hypothetical protein